MERTVGNIGSLSVCGSGSSPACYCQLIAIDWQPCWGQLTLVGLLAGWCRCEEGGGGDLEVSQHSPGYTCLRASENNEPVGDAYLESPFS